MPGLPHASCRHGRDVPPQGVHGQTASRHLGQRGHPPGVGRRASHPANGTGGDEAPAGATSRALVFVQPSRPLRVHEWWRRPRSANQANNFYAETSKSECSTKRSAGFCVRLVYIPCCIRGVLSYVYCKCKLSGCQLLFGIVREFAKSVVEIPGWCVFPQKELFIHGRLSPQSFVVDGVHTLGAW